MRGSNIGPATSKVESDCAVHQAIVEGEVTIVFEFLASGGLASITDRFDCEPIYTAVKFDQLEIAKKLLEAGGDIHRSSKFRGDTLGAACANRNLRMIDFCVAAGVDVNTVKNGQTYLDVIVDQQEDTPEEDLAAWQATYDSLLRHGGLRFREKDR